MGPPLRTRRGRIDAPQDGCLNYRYPLRAMSDRLASAPDDVLVTQLRDWLWTPRLAGDDRVRISVTHDSDTQIFLPLRRSGDGVYLLLPSPRSSDAVAMFGRLTHIEVPVAGGGRLSATLVGDRLDERKIGQWLSITAGDVAEVGGQFPNPHAQIVVVDVGNVGGDSPIPFGHVIRNGEEVVRFFVDGRRSLQAFVDDWTATHEFAHLLLPYIRGDQKWLSEGFASYYQNVLLARRDAYSEQEVWQRLVARFASARNTRRAPSLNDAHRRDFWDMRMLIYWSGAALALMADVELRQKGMDLDTVLGRFAECCLPSDRTWSAREYFSALERTTPEAGTVLTDLYDRYADRRGMPDVEGLYAALGVVVRNGKVTLRDDAPRAALRRAIMGQNADP